MVVKLKKFLKVLSYVFFVPYLFVVVFLTVCLLNYNDYNITEIGDKSFIIIRDDELEPKYKENDLVIVNRNKLDEVKRGDEIFFYDNYRNQVVVNVGKVIDVEKVTDTESTFVVEGNHSISSEFFIGKAATSNVYGDLGGILAILESRWGYLFIVVFPILLIFIYEIYAFIMEVKKPLEDE